MRSMLFSVKISQWMIIRSKIPLCNYALKDFTPRRCPPRDCTEGRYNMEWFELSIETTHQACEAIGGVLLSCGVNCWAVEDKADLTDFMQHNRELWDYVDDSLLERGEGVTVKVYLADNEQGRETMLLIGNALADFKKRETELDLGPLTVKTGTVNEEDWANAWKKYFHPIEIGDRLTVCPSWEDYDNASGRKVLSIDPGSAFGTGGHATTKLCLTLLDGMDCKGKSVLDVGCGSGILAVAALLLGADKALGVDIDLNSVNVAQQTALRNGVQDRADFRQADLAAGVTGKYDIVTANIVADIVMRLTPDVPALLAPDGRYIVSGIIDERVEEVVRCLNANGFAAEKLLQQEGWAAICAVRA